MIISYNLDAVGDVLLIVMANGEGKDIKTERKEQVVKITDAATGEILGWNIFEASKMLPDLTGNGQIHLTDGQVLNLQTLIKKVGFTDELVIDQSPKFVVGFVKSCVPHPDSDHLSITETEVDNGDVLQIVCGAPNIEQGQKVVVAKVGAMMPDGLIIWPGELRGEASFGMICSAKELHLPDAPTKKGILELPADEITGREFVIGR
ncbi:tRNA-binding protein [Vagococcus penaei]|uniref:tRNA-binding protein n=1 Tax=Vagococcus penaei TaxID=633807 RepID=A0A1Q2D6Z8_9ENTE|nr:DUF4479 and tRNA-binding domain-containing protein [Vagococcus penaei]AQP54100.1 tRNA-binding protein [Vagococcus penaei]RSU02097.1 tRNA-binding protein [Vagococcus penaei]